MRCERYRQSDLFEPKVMTPILHPSLQAKLASLLQVLLTEAAGIKRVGYRDREISDDQNHA